MADVSGKFFSAKKVRTGVSPSSPGVIEGETLPPVNPPGGGLNSVGLTMPSAFNVANSPLTSNGSLDVTGAGTTAQYIRGDGSLASFPSLTGFVPYTGATQNVDLGEFGVDAGFVNLDTTPTNTPTTQGTIYWDDARSTAALIMNGTIQHIGQDTFFYVKNATGSSIPKGTAVRFAGTDGASGHLLITPFLANGSVPSTYFMGVTAEVIANGGFGQVMHFGELEGINTSGFTAGSLLYASTTVAGGFQTAIPVAPNNIVLIAATINSKNNGAILVRPTYGSNINTDEGVKITSPATGQLLQLQAGGLWENKTLGQVIGGTSSQFLKGDGSLDSNVYALNSALASYQLLSAKGQPNGYAGLDSNGKVPLTQINDALIGNVNFQGLWNAATNTPTLANPPAAGTKGYYYIVSTAGTFAGISFEVGDWIISDGSAWGKVDNTDAVSSVFGRTGNVTASNGDYNTSQVTESGNLYFTNARAIASVLTGYSSGAGTISAADTILSAIQKLNGNIGALVTGVSSVNGLTGAVTLTTTNIAEGTNLYYTEARVNANANVAANTAARHAAVTLGTANGLSLSTQQLSLGLASAGVTGALSGTDWSTFNNKQNALNGTGFVKISGTTISYDNSTYYLASNPSAFIALTSLSAGAGISYNNLTGVISSTITQYTNAMARAALSFVAGSGAYNSTTGVITIPTDNNQIANGAGYITSAALGAYLPLAGGTMTGNINWGQTDRGLTWAFNTDAAYIKFFNTGDGDTDSRLEFGTQDNNNEYFRWGHVPSGGSFYESMRLVPNGNGSAELIVTGKIIKSGGTTSQFLKANGDVDSNAYYLASNPAGYTTNVGTVTSVAALTLGTSGTDLSSSVANGTTTPVITLNVPTASASNRGALSAADWTTFNNKQNALTNPVTGTGTTNYLPKFTGASTIGNSAIQDDGSSVLIGRETFITGTTAYFQVGNAAGATGKFQIESTSGAAIIGTRDDSSILFRTNLTTKLTLNSAGNLGLGVTPSAWSGDFTALEFGRIGTSLWTFDGNGNTGLSSNAYNTGTWRYANNGASAYNEVNSDGTFKWYTAPSGTAGNAISFTQAMTLTAAGRLLINTPTESTFHLDVNGTGRFSQTGAVPLTVVRTSANSNVGIRYQNNTTSWYSGLASDDSFSVSFNDPNLATGQFKLTTTGAATFSSSVTAGGTIVASLDQGSNNQFFNLTGTQSGFAQTYSFGIAGSTRDLRIFDITANTERMRITSEGNVLIGATAGVGSLRRELVIRGANGSVVSLGNNTTADRFQIVSDSGENALLNNKANTPMIFYTNNVERSRIFAGGNAHIGPTPSSDNGARLQVSGLTSFTNAGNSARFISSSNDVWTTFVPQSGNSWRIQATTGSVFGIYNENSATFPLTIASTGAATFTGALNGTSASFTGAVSSASKYTWGSSTSGTTGQIATDGTNNYFDYIGSLIFRGAAASNTLVTFSSTGAATLTGALNGTSASFTGAVGAASLSGAFATLSNFGSATSTALQLGDANNGLFRPALNSVAIATNGSAALTLASTGAATFSSSVTAEGSRMRALDFFSVGSLNDTDGSFLIDHPGINTWKIGITNANTSTFSIGNDNGGAFAAKYLNITNSGNVGIGTATPSQRLEVNGRVRISTNGTNGGDIGVDDGGLAFSTQGVTPTIFFRNNYANESMRITNVGNVGIGTTSPNYLLHIAAGAANPQLQFSSTGTGSTTSDGFHIGVNNSTLNAFLLQKENAALQFLTNDTERMSIHQNGNIVFKGQSTTSLAEALFQNTNSALNFFATQTTSFSKDIGFFTDTTTAEERLRITSGGNILMSFASAGNVIIGTTSDSGDRLRVTGGNGNTFTETIMTFNPENDNRSGVAWRLGAASVASITPNRRLRVSVGGVEYYIGAVEV